jgi:hypothetical protein
MSNHVSNQLVITGPAAILDRFHEAAKGVWPWRKWNDPDDKVHQLMVTNFVKPPKEAINDYNEIGYRWCQSNLGTKWGAYGVQYERLPEQITYLFSTANTALADHVFLAMSTAFPELQFDYTYDEPGCEFEGGIGAKAGDITDEWEGSGADYRGILCGPPDRGEEVSQEGQS